jgi:hypothetical protein
MGETRGISQGLAVHLKRAVLVELPATVGLTWTRGVGCLRKMWEGFDVSRKAGGLPGSYPGQTRMRRYLQRMISFPFNLNYGA